MGEEIAFENGRISEFQGLVTLTSTSDQVMLQTVMHHSSTSTYVRNFIEIGIKNSRESQLALLPTSKSRDTKTSTKIKHPAPISFRYCAL